LEVGRIYNNESAPVANRVGNWKFDESTGIIASDTVLLACSGDCSDVYPQGAAVAINAISALGSTFAGWSGDADCSDGSVAMNADKTCTATFTLNTYTVASSVPGDNGTISCTSPVNHGGASTCTITPGEGYHLAALTDNTFDVIGSVAGSSYVISNVTADHGVTGAFAIDTFAITTNAGPNGTITCTPNPVDYGGSSTCSVTPATGYHIASVAVDSVSQSATSPYTFTNVQAAHTIAATFNDLAGPALTVSTLADGSWTNNGVLHVNGTVSDGGSGLKALAVNGAPVTVNGGAYSTEVNLVEGANGVTVVATDNADNATTDTRTINYDSAAPAIAIIGPADNTTTNVSTTTIFGSLDANSTVTGVTSNGASVSFTFDAGSRTFWAVVALASGTNAIQVNAEDLAHNTASAVRTITYDSAAPSVSSGAYHTCGLKADGTVACWGDNDYGQAPASVAGPFTQVSAGGAHTCGLKADGTVACWGENYYGEAPASMAGPFTQVSGGYLHTCGVKADGTVACWGDNGDGQAPASVAGPFTQVSAGSYHTCGVKADGTVACWGYNGDGEAPASVAGPFTQVSSGAYHTCGVKTDGTVACWGYNYYGQAPVISVTPQTLPGGTNGVSYSQTVTASGGTAPYTIKITTGSLPPGLSLSSGGELSGTPTSPGTYTFRIEAVDSSAIPFSGAGDYMLTIKSMSTTSVSLTAGSNPSIYGQAVTFTATVTSGATGTVTFSEGGTIYCANVALNGTTAACGISSLNIGLHTLTATYSGDASFSGSSGSVTQTVNLAPIDGVCGPANGATFTTAPTENLCAAGAPTTVTGTGPWSWTCNGQYNGANVLCGASIQTYQLTTNATGTGSGSVASSTGGISYNYPANSSGSTPLNHGASVTLTATAAAGSSAEWSSTDCSSRGGTSTVATCTITSMTAPKTVTAIFNDINPPDTSIGLKPASPTKNTAASFEFTSTEANSNFVCRLDGGTFAACTSPKGYTGLTEGSHTFDVRAVDPAGNADATPATFTWTIDLTPPDTTIDSKPPTISASATATFSFTSTEANSTLECSIDGNAFAACTSPMDYSSLAIGNHSFEVRATDGVGNVDASPVVYTWERGVMLTVNFEGAGAGTVTGNVDGFSCNGTYSQPFSWNRDIALMATPDAYSHFDGWSGACPDTSGNCPLTMDSDKSVTATFIAAPRARNASTGMLYPSLSDALALANSGDEIWMLDTQLDGAVTLDKAIILKGGWNASFQGKSGLPTLLNGDLTIQNGNSSGETIDVKGKITVQSGSLLVNGVDIR
jgi:hypothetical protein